MVDPHRTDVRNGHCSPAYLRGELRLVAFELRMRHRGQTHDPVKVGGHKVHLFDDGDFQHTSLSPDSRDREPRLVEGYVLPGGAARGWVTFELPVERQPRRLQIFTGYLSAEVCCWDLPVRGTDDHRQWCAEQELDGRRSQVAALEHRAEVARRVLEWAEEVEALEARAARALAVLAELERTAGAEESYAAWGRPRKTPPPGTTDEDGLDAGSTSPPPPSPAPPPGPDRAAGPGTGPPASDGWPESGGGG